MIDLLYFQSNFALTENVQSSNAVCIKAKLDQKDDERLLLGDTKPVHRIVTIPQKSFSV